MNSLSSLSSIVLSMVVASVVAASEATCTRCAALARPCIDHVYTADDDEQPSWIFSRSTYTHDPYTGARVAQYQRLPSIEPLDDERLVTSRYHRVQTNLRGTNGSSESYYDVQAWGNGRGGIDAEWERFHNAWKDSYLQGGFYNQRDPRFGYGNPRQFGNGGFGGPGFGYGFGPGYGFGNSGYGFPGNGFPGIGNGGPYGGNQGGGWNGNGRGRRGGGAAQYNGHGHAGDWN